MFALKFDKTMEEVKQALDQQEDVVIVDVREKEEYEEGHLPHAVLVPLSILDTEATKLSKDQTLYVYCRSGQRSRTAVKKLKAMGYEHVYNVGGMIHWQYELESR